MDSLEAIESTPGCESCKENRKVLEQAWQVVANEYFDPTGKFSQTWWAGELQRSLADHGGTAFLLDLSPLFDIAFEQQGYKPSSYCGGIATSSTCNVLASVCV